MSLLSSFCPTSSSGLLLPIKCWQDAIMNVESGSDLFSSNFPQSFGFCSIHFQLPTSRHLGKGLNVLYLLFLFNFIIQGFNQSFILLGCAEHRNCTRPTCTWSGPEVCTHGWGGGMHLAPSPASAKPSLQDTGHHRGSIPAGDKCRHGARPRLKIPNPFPGGSSAPGHPVFLFTKSDNPIF